MSELIDLSCGLKVVIYGGTDISNYVKRIVIIKTLSIDHPFKQVTVKLELFSGHMEIDGEHISITDREGKKIC